MRSCASHGGDPWALLDDHLPPTLRADLEETLWRPIEAQATLEVLRRDPGFFDDRVGTPRCSRTMAWSTPGTWRRGSSGSSTWSTASCPEPTRRAAASRAEARGRARLPPRRRHGRPDQGRTPDAPAVRRARRVQRGCGQLGGPPALAGSPAGHAGSDRGGGPVRCPARHRGPRGVEPGGGPQQVDRSRGSAVRQGRPRGTHASHRVHADARPPRGRPGSVTTDERPDPRKVPESRIRPPPTPTRGSRHPTGRRPTWPTTSSTRCGRCVPPTSSDSEGPRCARRGVSRCTSTGGPDTRSAPCVPPTAGRRTS